jgi:uncharacterized protein (TIGR00288 family)
MHTHAPNAALLIDFDNVTMGIRSDLQLELKNLLSSAIIKGKVAVRRAYADWRRYPQYIVPLTESSIDLIFAPAYGSAKKNATDIRLAIDALELVFTRPEIGTFVLLSGDSDFSSMVIKLKEYGKYVIGVGIRESSSDLLVMNCDEYYSYNALAGLVKNGEDETTRWDAWELVKESVTRMKRNGDVMRSDRLKQVMQEIDNSFDEKNLGMPKFSRFVQEAAHRGLLLVTKLESGQLEIDIPEGATPAVPPGETPAAAGTGDSEARREAAERERDDRRGRRGRRGRGRDRGRPDRDTADTDVTSAAEAPVSASAPAPADAKVAASEPAVVPTSTAAPRSEPKTVAPTPAAPTSAAPAVPAFGVDVADHIGTSGERLTRNEAFDLVRRAVESLVTGDDSTSASAARQRAFELLGRNSESLSLRNFERVLQDAHDADMIDLRRRGHDYELARAAEATSIVEQLKKVDDEQKAVADAKAALLPPVPRGMGARGIGGKSKGPSGPPPGLLMVGVVGAAPAPTSTSAAKPAPAPAPKPAPAAEKPVVKEAAPVVEAAASAAASAAAPAAASPEADAKAKPAKTAKKAAKKATKASGKTAAKKATKSPAKPKAGAASAPAKSAAMTATKSATKTAAKKAPAKKAPAKKAAKKASS